MFLKVSRGVVSHKTNVFLDRLQSTSNVFKRGKYQDYMKVKIVAHTSEDDICNCSVLRLISGRISFEVARFSQTESICCKLSHFPSKLMYKKAEIFNGLEIPTDSKKTFIRVTHINQFPCEDKLLAYYNTAEHSLCLSKVLLLSLIHLSSIFIGYLYFLYQIVAGQRIIRDRQKDTHKFTTD